MARATANSPFTGSPARDTRSVGTSMNPRASVFTAETTSVRSDIAAMLRPMRIDRVYTRGGDKGETSLIGGERVSKADSRLDCYGTVDELNATLGVVRTVLEESAAGSHLLPIVHRVQNELFNLGAELAAPDPQKRA